VSHHEFYLYTSKTTTTLLLEAFDALQTHRLNERKRRRNDLLLNARSLESAFLSKTCDMFSAFAPR
jgi:hypothetical protein